jgi:hypothetical protein
MVGPGFVFEWALVHPVGRSLSCSKSLIAGLPRHCIHPPDRYPSVLTYLEVKDLYPQMLFDMAVGLTKMPAMSMYAWATIVAETCSRPP